MPITPYTQGIKYQYSPLGLENFAAPLSKMQEQFDITKMGVEAEDFDLSHLPYGTDPEKARALKEQVTSKRDELSKNLQQTKNYREASLKLLELRKLWKNDPEINALQSNYKKFQELDKEQKERADKGDISRDQYLQWKNRAIEEYSTKGGTAFKATETNREGEYNPFGRIGRLKNLDKEIEEDKLKVMQLQPEKVRDFFSQAGATLSDQEVHSIETLVKEKRFDELKAETEAILRTRSRYTDYLTEVSDYNFYDLQKNPEEYKTQSNQLVSSYLTDSNQYTQAQEAAAKKGDKAAKKYLESADYKKLKETQDSLQQMISSGKYDENIVKNLYTQKHIDKVFDATNEANILSYKNSTASHSFRNLPKEGNGSGSGDEDATLTGGFFTPSTYEKQDIAGLGRQRAKSGQNIYTALGETHKIGNGVLGMISRGRKGTSEYEYNTKHPDVMVARDKEILAAYSATIAGGGDAKEFHRRIKHLGSNATEQNAKALFNNFNSNPYSAQKLESSLKAVDYDYNNYLNAKENLESISKSAAKTPEYDNIINNQIGNTTPRIWSMGNELYENKNLYLLFDKDHYTDEQYKKAGVTKPKGGGFSTVDENTLTFNQVAKLKGYKNTADALNKGFTFQNAPIIGEYGTGNIKIGQDITAKEGSKLTINSYEKELKQKLLDKGLVKNEMSYRYVGDKNADKQIMNYFLQENDLSNFQPAYSENQKGQPGFDEEGKLLPSTTFDFTDKTTPKMIKHGNSLFLEVPIKYKNEDGVVVQGTTIVKPKKGYELSFERLLNKIDQTSSDFNKGESADPLDRQTNDMVKVAKFDQRYKSNFSNSLVKAVNVGEELGSQEIVTAIPFDANNPNMANVNIEVVKVSTGDGGYTMKVRLNNGVSTKYLDNPETGQPFYSSNADAVKAFIAKQVQL